jgi:hypothetical protein
VYGCGYTMRRTRQFAIELRRERDEAQIRPYRITNVEFFAAGVYPIALLSGWLRSTIGALMARQVKVTSRSRRASQRAAGRRQLPRSGVDKHNSVPKSTAPSFAATECHVSRMEPAPKLRFFPLEEGRTTRRSAAAGWRHIKQLTYTDPAAGGAQPPAAAVAADQAPAGEAPGPA